MLHTLQADGIDNNGHGTHVMGTLLGSPFDISNATNLDYRSSSRLPSRFQLTRLKGNFLASCMHCNLTSQDVRGACVFQGTGAGCQGGVCGPGKLGGGRHSHPTRLGQQILSVHICGTRACTIILQALPPACVMPQLLRSPQDTTALQ